MILMSKKLSKVLFISTKHKFLVNQKTLPLLATFREGTTSFAKNAEGTVVNVPMKGGRKHPQQEFIAIDTSNILFVVELHGPEPVIEARLNARNIGFLSGSDRGKIDEHSIFKHVQHEDLLKFGIIPELIGRLPLLSHDLDESALVKILKDQKCSKTISNTFVNG